MATCVDRDATMKDATFAQMKELRLPAHLNAALCFNKLKDYMNAKKHCDIVISEEETNVKALYRRAEALIGLQELKSACNDLKKVMTVEPKNAAAQKLLHTTQATVFVRLHF
jgi:tetratricopeptide (TPR) repeat protein